MIPHATLQHNRAEPRKTMSQEPSHAGVGGSAGCPRDIHSRRVRIEPVWGPSAPPPPPPPQLHPLCISSPLQFTSQAPCTTFFSLLSALATHLTSPPILSLAFTILRFPLVSLLQDNLISKLHGHALDLCAAMALRLCRSDFVRLPNS